MAAAVVLLAALAAQVAPAQGSASSFEDFPVFVWRQAFHGEEIPARVFAPFGGINVEREGAVPRIEGHDAPPRFYVGHAPGREEFHLRRSDGWYDAMWQTWYEERDVSALVRQPCLSDPETQKRMLETLKRSLAARNGNSGSAISLGDEIGLTPAGDPLDLCHSEFCRAAAPAAPATDDVRRAWLDEETDGIGAWLARRRFHATVVHDLAEELSLRARELAPTTPRTLFGVKTQTAFGGVDVARALNFVEWIEPYGDTVTRELCFTLRRPEQRVFATIFPAKDRPERAALRLAEHVLRGGNGAVIWSDRHLARSPAYLERLARATSETRALRKKLRELCGQEWAPQTSGWAVIEDADCVALSFLRDSLGDGPTWPRRFAGYQVEHGTRERAVNAWVRALEDSGLLPGALPLSALTVDVSRFPVLLLIEQAVLSESDERLLEAHLEAGGLLVVHGHFAEFGRDGAVRTSPLAGWRERFEGRVCLGSESPAAIAETVRGVSAAAELEGPVLAVRSGRTLRAEQRLGDGKRIVAMLPRPDGEEAALETVRLEFALAEGWRILERLTPGSPLEAQGAEPSPSHVVELGPAQALYLLLSR